MLLFRTLLFSDKADSHPWVFVIIEAHLAIVLVVVFMLKQRDPLCIIAHSTVVDYRLRNANTTELVCAVNKRCCCLAHEDHLIFGQLVGKRNNDFSLWLKES